MLYLWWIGGYINNGYYYDVSGYVVVMLLGYQVMFLALIRLGLVELEANVSI